MDKILSIIIPTYNMEKYLNKCLDSLAVDNMDLLEILVINDGSKDRSSEIAHEYEKKYPNTFRVIDKENGNYGSCINRGLKEATGKYIKVLDADDSFNKQNLQLFLKKLLTIDVDLIISDYIIVDELDNEHTLGTYRIPNDKLLKFDDSIVHITSSIQMHAITYLRENLLSINYKQTEGISYTDQEWIFLPMTTVNDIYYYQIPLYRYLVGREGQTMNKKVMNNSFNQLEKVLYSLIYSYESYKGNDNKKQYLRNRILSNLIYIYTNAILFDYYDKNKIIEFDYFIKKWDEDLYEEMNNLKVHKYLPYKFIEVWRHKKDISYIVKYIYRTIQKLKR